MIFIIFFSQKAFVGSGGGIEKGFAKREKGGKGRNMAKGKRSEKIILCILI